MKLNENLQFCQFVESQQIDKYRSKYIVELNDQNEDAMVKISGGEEFFFIFGLHKIGNVISHRCGDMEFNFPKQSEGIERNVDCISFLLCINVYIQSLGFHNSTGTGDILINQTGNTRCKRSQNVYPGAGGQLQGP